MLINHAIERARGFGLASLLLARRARAVSERAPVIVVPPILGTQLVDERGRTLWGSVARIFYGPPVASSREARPGRLLEGLTIVPGLYRYDVFGGLMRFLERVGGYRRGEDLFALEYDWRTGIVDAAARLAELVARIRGVGSERVDLVAISSGGMIARAFLACGAASPLDDAPDARSAPGLPCVRRVVYVGAPQRGAFSAIDRIVNAVVMAPGGKHFTELRALQICYDMLPHPGDPLFVDDRGRALPLDIYDAGVWSRLGLRERDVPDLGAKLEHARKLHLALDGAGGHPDCIVIGARHQPTAARIVVTGAAIRVPPCCPDPTDPFIGYIYQPGDGSVPEASLRAAPGVEERRIWFVEPSEHHEIGRDPEVHRLIVEALLAAAWPGPGAAPPVPLRRRGATAG